MAWKDGNKELEPVSLYIFLFIQVFKKRLQPINLLLNPPSHFLSLFFCVSDVASIIKISLFCLI